MKINQDAKFQPVIITLETPEEVMTLWDGISYTIANFKSKESNRIRLLIAISDWFSQHAKI